MPLKNIAIIGAGLSGLSLALFLSRQDFNVTIYDLRSPTATTEGAVMLSPNALRTLDALGVYTQLQRSGFSFRNLHFNTDDPSPKLLDTYEMGNSSEFGYDALRIYRQTIIDELKTALNSSGVPVMHGMKFSHILSETPSSVSFAFTDGQIHTADVLIGADGIHSTVRRYLFPELSPEFSTFMAVTAAVRISDVVFPSNSFGLPSSTHGRAGAFVIAPQSEVEALVGIQHRTEDRGREEWEAMARDKEGLRRIMRRGYEEWRSPMVRSAMDAVPVESMSMWPFFTVPTLESWFSKGEGRHGRVVILGDSAHAIPPAAGQGANQALEDSHALALVMAVLREREHAVTDEGSEWLGAIQWWQEYRQARIQKVGALTNEMNRRRMPDWNGEGETMDSSWLFNVEIAKDVENWANGN